MYYSAKTASMSDYNESTSGGAIRTIVKVLLERGDVAEAVMTCSSGFGAETMIIKDAATRIPATCYSYNRSLVSTLLSLPQDTRRVIVALPCQARKAREMLPSALIISTVCYQTVREEAIMGALEKCGLSLAGSKIMSVYRRHNELFVQTSENLLTTPFKRFWRYLKFYNFSNPQCIQCEDHLGKSADIVVCDHEHRSNMVLVRTINGVIALGSSAHMLQIKGDKFHRLRVAFLIKTIRYKGALLIGKTLYRKRRAITALMPTSFSIIA